MWNFKQQFENDGYVAMEGFFTNEEVNEMIAECNNLIKNMPEEKNRTVFSSVDLQQSKQRYFLESADKIRYFYEAEALGPNGELKVDANVSLNKIGHALHDLNPTFRKFSFDKRIKECFRQLDFVDPVIVQSMYIFKNPGIGSEVTIHQDATYLHTEPMKLVGIWIALEDATLENGCLWFAKGSHKSGVHRRYIRNPDKNSDDLLIYTTPPPEYEESEFTPAPVKKGSCVLIHGQVVHFSEPNTSNKSRHAYTFHVAEQKNTKYSENNWLQPPPNKPFLSLYKN